MPGKPILPIPQKDIEKLVSVLEDTPEFPFHDNLIDPVDKDRDEDE